LMTIYRKIALHVKRTKYARDGRPLIIMGMAEASAEFVRTKIRECSFFDLIFPGENPAPRFIAKCSLCGQPKDECTFYDCMPYEIRLRYAAHRHLMRHERRRKFEEQMEKMFNPKGE
jgi:hypothetical protein